MQISFQQTMIAACATELAAHLGRPVAHLTRNGLGARDFPNNAELRVRLADGSQLTFLHAFSVSRASTNELFVFTEHCGHHVFPLEGAEVHSIAGQDL